MAQFARILFCCAGSDIRFLCLAQNTSGRLLWNFPGGKVEPGETALDAAIREAREELGLRCKKEQLQLISRKRIQLEQREWIGFFYLSISSSKLFKIKEREKITDARYLTLAQMKNRPAFHDIFSDIARQALFRLMEHEH